MEEEFDAWWEDAETLDVVKRFERMIESEGYVFLDSQEFEKSPVII